MFNAIPTYSLIHRPTQPLFQLQYNWPSVIFSTFLLLSAILKSTSLICSPFSTPLTLACFLSLLKLVHVMDTVLQWAVSFSPRHPDRLRQSLQKTLCNQFIRFSWFQTPPTTTQIHMIIRVAAMVRNQKNIHLTSRLKILQPDTLGSCICDFFVLQKWERFVAEKATFIKGQDTRALFHLFHLPLQFQHLYKRNLLKWALEKHVFWFNIMDVSLGKTRLLLVRHAACIVDRCYCFKKNAHVYKQDNVKCFGKCLIEIQPFNYNFACITHCCILKSYIN